VSTTHLWRSNTSDYHITEPEVDFQSEGPPVTQLLRCQQWCFCTSKASKLRTSRHAAATLPPAPRPPASPLRAAPAVRRGSHTRQYLYSCTCTARKPSSSSSAPTTRSSSTSVSTRTHPHHALPVLSTSTRQYLYLCTSKASKLRRLPLRAAAPLPPASPRPPNPRQQTDCGSARGCPPPATPATPPAYVPGGVG
jgi:hypothetical protein